MKLLFWNLDHKEKFIRAFWTGIIALIGLFTVSWFLFDDVTIKIGISSALTILFVADLLIRYRRMKRMNVQS